MKRAVLDRDAKISEKNKIFIKLFEKNLCKKLDEIFKKESKDLYNCLNKSLKKAICHPGPNNNHHPESY